MTTFTLTAGNDTVSTDSDLFGTVNGGGSPTLYDPSKSTVVVSVAKTF